jgi:predicted O-linked N-acetylglucosamine transferase (SPINDLY family)
MASLSIDQAIALGQKHHREGRLPEAEVIYRQILDRSPDHVDALVSLGALRLQAGTRPEAVALFSRVIASRPNDPWTYLTVGQVLHVHGALDDAAHLYRHALELFPASDEFCYRLGHVERARNHLQAAIGYFQRAIHLRPQFPEARSNLGLSLEEAGRSDDAVRELQQAVRLDGTRPEDHYNLAISLTTLGRLDEASTAYRHAIALHPDFAEAHNNLGAVAKTLGQLDDAAASFQTALRIRPTLSAAESNLAGVYEWQAQHDEALAAHRRAMDLAPESPGTHSNYLYTLLFHPGYDAAMLREAHEDWNCRHARSLRPVAEAYANDRSPERRLRVGYVCSVFRDHVLGRNLMPLLREHDRRALQVICYSNNRVNDAITEEFRRIAAEWREIAALSDDAVAQMIRHDAIDILVDTTLHMEGNRLLVFARKPAPVQVTFAGYPGSTGLETIDYRLTDGHLDPPGVDAPHVERSWRLPDTFWCYDPLGDSPAVGALPALARGYVTFGCLNNFSKTNDGVLALWARVLIATPRSRLLILAHEGSHRQRARDVLRAHGIQSDRIEFAGYRRRDLYLELFGQIDIGLDTVPYNGHTTSLDSFWMGVPVVTLVGNTVVGRAGASQLTNLRLPELIARTPDEYVAIATALAQDTARLATLRHTLRERMQSSPLMDAPRFARGVETAYSEIWRRWCACAATSAAPDSVQT